MVMLMSQFGFEIDGGETTGPALCSFMRLIRSSCSRRR